jgi:hypothetical protein
MFIYSTCLFRLDSFGFPYPDNPGDWGELGTGAVELCLNQDDVTSPLLMAITFWRAIPALAVGGRVTVCLTSGGPDNYRAAPMRRQDRV